MGYNLSLVQFLAETYIHWCGVGLVWLVTLSLHGHLLPCTEEMWSSPSFNSSRLSLLLRILLSRDDYIYFMLSEYLFDATGYFV